MLTGFVGKSASRAHANRDDINANGVDKTQPCVRCLKVIATSDPLELKCKVMDAYDGGRKCGRCVGMGKACFEVSVFPFLVVCRLADG